MAKRYRSLVLLHSSHDRRRGCCQLKRRASDRWSLVSSQVPKHPKKRGGTPLVPQHPPCGWGPLSRAAHPWCSASRYSPAPAAWEERRRKGVRTLSCPCTWTYRGSVPSSVRPCRVELSAWSPTTLQSFEQPSWQHGCHRCVRAGPNQILLMASRDMNHSPTSSFVSQQGRRCPHRFEFLPVCDRGPALEEPSC